MAFKKFSPLGEMVDAVALKAPSFGVSVRSRQRVPKKAEYKNVAIITAGVLKKIVIKKRESLTSTVFTVGQKSLKYCPQFKPFLAVRFIKPLTKLHDIELQMPLVLAHIQRVFSPIFEVKTNVNNFSISPVSRNCALSGLEIRPKSRKSAIHFEPQERAELSLVAGGPGTNAFNL